MELRSSVFLNSAAISVLRVTSGLPTPLLYAVWIPDSPVSAYVNFYSRSSRLRLRDTDSGRGHMVKSNVYNFRADAYAAIN